MTAMTCKLNGLFSIGEDFDDEDLLETEWAAPSTSVSVSATVSSCGLRASSVASGDQSSVSLRQTGGSFEAPGGHTEATVGQTVPLGLRQIVSSIPRSYLSTLTQTLNPPPLKNAQPNVASHQISPTCEMPQKASVVQDEFDDWDVDLADLDESATQMGTGVHNQQTLKSPAPSPAVCAQDVISSANQLRPSTCGRAQPITSTPYQAFGLSSSISTLSHQHTSFISMCSPRPRPTSIPTSPHGPRVFPGSPSASPLPSPIPRTPRGPHQPQRPWSTPGPHPQGRNLSGPISQVSSSMSSPANSPRLLNAPVFTNRLAQLVSASNKPLRKRPHSDAHQLKTRRFPGPAGLLPQQPLNQSLDDIVVSVPQTPAHGAVARLSTQCSSSQSDEEEFSGGPWGAMKAEMGLDERNPSCFLHSYSVVMVLRKAALKQLIKNKVPNMAVLLKSIIYTHADAKAMFKDPTGEIQGTVHRRLLEDRQGELKAGAVLLLKQVGVFSPSHRNHYLNITPSNLLRIYPPAGVCPSSSAHLPPLVLEPACPSADPSPFVPGAPVFGMQLELDEEEGERREEGQVPHIRAAPGSGSKDALPEIEHAPQDPAWDDDDLNELLGDLLEASSSL